MINFVACVSVMLNTISSQRWDWKFRRDRGGVCGGVIKKIPSMREVWIFLGTIKFILQIIKSASV